jgi:hypothetical protein
MSKKMLRRLGAILLLCLAFVGLIGGHVFADSNDPLDPDYVDPLGTVDDSDQKGCTKESSSWSWFPCSLNKVISGASRSFFESKEHYMKTDPKIFENDALKLGWKTARNLANVIVIVMLLVTIVSQISGFGITNYGVKKALPRIVVIAVLVNLSYVICQIAVDVMNISGEAIRNAFDPITNSAWSKVHYSPGTFASIAGGGSSSALTIILAYFGTKTFLASGESIILLALFVGISILAGVLLLLATITVRSALVVLLTITSPLAVVMAVFPGTKRAFNRWFDLFKGVLICYPMAALLVYGGNFASVIAMAALGLNSISIGGIDLPVNVFTLMVSAAASVAPLIALPGLIIKSTGAIGATMQRFARNLSGAIKGGIGGSAFGEQLRRGATDRRNRMIAGVDKNGNKKNSFLSNRFRSRNADERFAAEQALAGSRAKRRAEEWNDAQDDNIAAMDEQAKAYAQELEESNTADSEIEAVFDDIFSDLDNVDVARIEGAIRYFSKNPKSGVDDALLRHMDDLDPTRYADLRRNIARQRLRNGGNMMIKKTPMQFAYLTAVAQGDTRQYYKSGSRRGPKDIDDAWIQAAVNGSTALNGTGNVIDIPTRFNGVAMSNYAGPALEAMGNYVLNHSDATAQNIRTCYDQMTRTASYRKNAAGGDFDGIKRAIESSHNNPTP